VTYRIEVGPKPEIDDPRGAAAARQAREFLGLSVDTIRTRSVYKIAGLELVKGDLERIRLALADPVLEQSAIDRMPLPAKVTWVIGVGFLPGVTDNLGRTARVFLADVLGRDLPAGARVFTETLYLLQGDDLELAAVDRIADELLANRLIQSVTTCAARNYVELPVDLEIPHAGGAEEPTAEPVPLPGEDQALAALSRDRTLSLSLEELRAIRAHFASDAQQARRKELGLPSDPTDVELEALAQTWSEHCKHKIFNARITYEEAGERETINSLFKTYIVEPTRRIAERVDWLVSVFDDNAGIVRLTPETNLVYKVETHNSPSALDPYGGAMTGIVGVNRDPLGTGIGAELLTNVWGYCLGPPAYDGVVPEGLLHPRRVRDGVHLGVIDGGNQSGIPYSRGFEIFDDRYLGKPLVFCGTVGLMPAEVAGRPSHINEVEPGDLVVMVGGRIGKDGIHGATFSSEVLHGKSPAQAVQIGDPLTQKKMSDMLLEARDQGLFRALTDNGAGGLSSSVGEMAELCGGAELELDKAPLKYSGLHPWEILVSEAQERMSLAVPPDRLEALLELARRREVEATVVGRFTDSGYFELRYQGRHVGSLEMAFLHDGCPLMELEARWTPPEPRALDLEGLEPGALLGELLASLDICSKQQRWRQYDHEVKGLSVIKPLVGVRGDIPADATVMRVRHGQPEAVLVSEGIAPRLSDLDAGAMAASVVDLAARRIVAAGGRLGQIAGLDNFCWPDPVQSESTPDGHHKLAALVRACRGLAEMTEGLDLPCISGKDSMKNDSVRGGVKISIPPTLLFSALGWIEDVSRALDLTPGAAGEQVYLLGETAEELGGSALSTHLGQQGRGCAPWPTPERCRAVCAATEAAAADGLLSAAHAPHAGGLAVSLAELCLAGGLGLEGALDGLDGLEGGEALGDVALLYSESGARMLLVAPASKAAALEALLEARGVPWARLGQMVEQPLLRLERGGRPVLEQNVDALRCRFKETLDEL
jgi:phosphoribosylformylglycinamidine synthase subunit PurSL